MNHPFAVSDTSADRPAGSPILGQKIATFRAGFKRPWRGLVPVAVASRPLLPARALHLLAGLDKTAPARQPARMKPRSPRLAARALIVHQDRLLLVNAYPGGVSDLWCAPGGGVEAGASLPDNLAREVAEETGLGIRVEAPALVNEFHDPASGFHQVDIYFRCTITQGVLCEDWRDPEGVVTKRRFFSRAEMATIRFKPDSLPDAAWGQGILYDPLEVIVR